MVNMEPDIEFKSPPLDLQIDSERVKKIENFLKSDDYRAMVAGTKKYNRKLNEERKTRMPYVDGQTGIAQKNNNCERSRRERMPGKREGQIYTYPSKRWKKTSYQYLKYINAPRNMGFGQEVEAWPQDPMVPLPVSVAERQPPRATSLDTNIGGMAGLAAYAGGFYEDELDMPDQDSESDDDYERGRNKKGKGKPKARSKTKVVGLSSGKSSNGPGGPGGRPSRKSSAPPPTYGTPVLPPEPVKDSFEPPQVAVQVKKNTPTGYCDFCLGGQAPDEKLEDGKVINKTTQIMEELISCGECGHSGHPKCLQFTENMLTSVRGYAWQCMECKACTLCSTSENDDQLLFCDDCDRGYHMYCIVPPMKEAPEGSWSCVICVQRFHK